MPRSLSSKDERRIAIEVAWVMDAPMPHEHARPDQRGYAAADGAQQGGNKEYGEAGQVEALAPDDVREATHRQQQASRW